MAIMVNDPFLRLLFQIATGDEFPDLNETKMRLLADSYDAAADRLTELEPRLRRLVGQVRAEFSGQAAEAFIAVMAPYVEGPRHVATAVAHFRAMASVLRQLALTVEYMKLVVILQLALLAAAFEFAEAMSPWLGPLAWAWFEAHLPIAAAVIRAVMTAVKAGFPALSKVAALGKHALIAIVASFGTQLGVTVGAQFIQMHVLDTRADGDWDEKYMSDAAVVAATALLVGPFTGVGGKELSSGLLQLWGKQMNGQLTPAKWVREVTEGLGDLVAGSLNEGTVDHLAQWFLTGTVVLNPFAFSAGVVDVVAGFVGAALGRMIRDIQIAMIFAGIPTYRPENDPNASHDTPPVPAPYPRVGGTYVDDGARYPDTPPIPKPYSRVSGAGNEPDGTGVADGEQYPDAPPVPAPYPRVRGEFTAAPLSPTPDGPVNGAVAPAGGSIAVPGSSTDPAGSTGGSSNAGEGRGDQWDSAPRPPDRSAPAEHQPQPETGPGVTESPTREKPGWALAGDSLSPESGGRPTQENTVDGAGDVIGAPPPERTGDRAGAAPAGSGADAPASPPLTLGPEEAPPGPTTEITPEQRPVNPREGPGHDEPWVRARAAELAGNYPPLSEKDFHQATFEIGRIFDVERLRETDLYASVVRVVGAEMPSGMERVRRFAAGLASNLNAENSQWRARLRLPGAGPAHARTANSGTRGQAGPPTSTGGGRTQSSITVPNSEVWVPSADNASNQRQHETASVAEATATSAVPAHAPVTDHPLPRGRSSTEQQPRPATPFGDVATSWHGDFAPDRTIETIKGVLAQAKVDTATLFGLLHQAMSRPDADRLATEIAEPLLDAQKTGRMRGPDFEHALAITGQLITFLADPAEEATIAGTAVRPPERPSMLPDVAVFAAAVRRRVLARDFDGATTLVGELNRDQQAVSAVSKAYFMRFGDELEIDLLIMRPAESSYIDHLFGHSISAPVSLDQALTWYRQMLDLTFDHPESGHLPVPFDYPVEGCELRAHLMALALRRLGAEPHKILVARVAPQLEVTISAPVAENEPAHILWDHHVAVAIKTRGKHGPRWMVFDPSLQNAVHDDLDASFDGLPDGVMSVESWLARMGVEVRAIRTVVGTSTYVRRVIADLRAAEPGAWTDFYPSGNAVAAITDSDTFSFPVLAMPPRTFADADSHYRANLDKLRSYTERAAELRADRALAEIVISARLDGAVNADAIIASLRALSAREGVDERELLSRNPTAAAMLADLLPGRNADVRNALGVPSTSEHERGRPEGVPADYGTTGIGLPSASHPQPSGSPVIPDSQQVDLPSPDTTSVLGTSDPVGIDYTPGTGATARPVLWSTPSEDGFFPSGQVPVVSAHSFDQADKRPINAYVQVKYPGFQGINRFLFLAHTVGVAGREGHLSDCMFAQIEFLNLLVTQRPRVALPSAVLAPSDVKRWLDEHFPHRVLRAYSTVADVNEYLRFRPRGTFAFLFMSPVSNPRFQHVVAVHRHPVDGSINYLDAQSGWPAVLVGYDRFWVHDVGVVGHPSTPSPSPFPLPGPADVSTPLALAERAEEADRELDTVSSEFAHALRARAEQLLAEHVLPPRWRDPALVSHARDVVAHELLRSAVRQGILPVLPALRRDVPPTRYSEIDASSAHTLAAEAARLADRDPNSASSPGPVGTAELVTEGIGLPAADHDSDVEMVDAADTGHAPDLQGLGVETGQPRSTAHFRPLAAALSIAIASVPENHSRADVRAVRDTVREARVVGLLPGQEDIVDAVALAAAWDRGVKNAGTLLGNARPEVRLTARWEAKLLLGAVPARPGNRATVLTAVLHGQLLEILAAELAGKPRSELGDGLRAQLSRETSRMREDLSDYYARHVDPAPTSEALDAFLERHPWWGAQPGAWGEGVDPARFDPASRSEHAMNLLHLPEHAADQPVVRDVTAAVAVQLVLAERGLANENTPAQLARWLREELQRRKSTTDFATTHAARLAEARQRANVLRGMAGTLEAWTGQEQRGLLRPGSTRRLTTEFDGVLARLYTDAEPAAPVSAGALAPAAWHARARELLGTSDRSGADAVVRGATDMVAVQVALGEWGLVDASNPASTLARRLRGEITSPAAKRRFAERHADDFATARNQLAVLRGMAVLVAESATDESSARQEGTPDQLAGELRAVFRRLYLDPEVVAFERRLAGLRIDPDVWLNQARQLLRLPPDDSVPSTLPAGPAAEGVLDDVSNVIAAQVVLEEWGFAGQGTSVALAARLRDDFHGLRDAHELGLFTLRYADDFVTAARQMNVVRRMADVVATRAADEQQRLLPVGSARRSAQEFREAFGRLYVGSASPAAIAAFEASFEREAAQARDRLNRWHGEADRLLGIPPEGLSGPETVVRRRMVDIVAFQLRKWHGPRAVAEKRAAALATKLASAFTEVHQLPPSTLDKIEDEAANWAALPLHERPSDPVDWIDGRFDRESDLAADKALHWLKEGASVLVGPVRGRWDGPTTGSRLVLGSLMTSIEAEPTIPRDVSTGLTALLAAPEHDLARWRHTGYEMLRIPAPTLTGHTHSARVRLDVLAAVVGRHFQYVLDSAVAGVTERLRAEFAALRRRFAQPEYVAWARWDAAGEANTDNDSGTDSDTDSGSGTGSSGTGASTGVGAAGSHEGMADADSVDGDSGTGSDSSDSSESSAGSGSGTAGEISRNRRRAAELMLGPLWEPGDLAPARARTAADQRARAYAELVAALARDTPAPGPALDRDHDRYRRAWQASEPQRHAFQRSANSDGVVRVHIDVPFDVAMDRLRAEHNGGLTGRIVDFRFFLDDLEATLSAEVPADVPPGDLARAEHAAVVRLGVRPKPQPGVGAAPVEQHRLWRRMTKVLTAAYLAQQVAEQARNAAPASMPAGTRAEAAAGEMTRRFDELRGYHDASARFAWFRQQHSLLIDENRVRLRSIPVDSARTALTLAAAVLGEPVPVTELPADRRLATAQGRVYEDLVTVVAGEFVRQVGEWGEDAVQLELLEPTLVEPVWQHTSRIRTEASLLFNWSPYGQLPVPGDDGVAVPSAQAERRHAAASDPDGLLTAVSSFQFHWHERFNEAVRNLRADSGPLATVREETGFSGVERVARRLLGVSEPPSWTDAYVADGPAEEQPPTAPPPGPASWPTSSLAHNLYRNALALVAYELANNRDAAAVATELSAGVSAQATGTGVSVPGLVDLLNWYSLNPRLDGNPAVSRGERPPAYTPENLPSFEDLPTAASGPVGSGIVRWHRTPGAEAVANLAREVATWPREQAEAFRLRVLRWLVPFAYGGAAQPATWLPGSQLLLSALANEAHRDSHLADSYVNVRGLARLALDGNLVRALADVAENHIGADPDQAQQALGRMFDAAAYRAAPYVSLASVEAVSGWGREVGRELDLLPQDSHAVLRSRAQRILVERLGNAVNLLGGTATDARDVVAYELAHMIDKRRLESGLDTGVSDLDESSARTMADLVRDVALRSLPEFGAPRGAESIPVAPAVVGERALPIERIPAGVFIHDGDNATVTAAARLLPAERGVFGVVFQAPTHGGPGVSVTEATNAIRATGWNGRDRVRLYVCNTGHLDEFALALSTELGVPVTWPVGMLWLGVGTAERPFEVSDGFTAAGQPVFLAQELAWRSPPDMAAWRYETALPPEGRARLEAITPVHMGPSTLEVPVALRRSANRVREAERDRPTIVGEPDWTALRDAVLTMTGDRVRWTTQVDSVFGDESMNDFSASLDGRYEDFPEFHVDLRVVGIDLGVAADDGTDGQMSAGEPGTHRRMSAHEPGTRPRLSVHETRPRAASSVDSRERTPMNTPIPIPIPGVGTIGLHAAGIGSTSSARLSVNSEERSSVAVVDEAATTNTKHHILFRLRLWPKSGRLPRTEDVVRIPLTLAWPNPEAPGGARHRSIRFGYPEIPGRAAPAERTRVLGDPDVLRQAIIYVDFVGIGDVLDAVQAKYRLDPNDAAVKKFLAWLRDLGPRRGTDLVTGEFASKKFRFAGMGETEVRVALRLPGHAQPTAPSGKKSVEHRRSASGSHSLQHGVTRQTGGSISYTVGADIAAAIGATVGASLSYERASEDTETRGSQWRSETKVAITDGVEKADIELVYLVNLLDAKHGTPAVPARGHRRFLFAEPPEEVAPDTNVPGTARLLLRWPDNTRRTDDQPGSGIPTDEVPHQVRAAWQLADDLQQRLMRAVLGPALRRMAAAGEIADSSVTDVKNDFAKFLNEKARFLFGGDWQRFSLPGEGPDLFLAGDLVAYRGKHMGATNWKEIAGTFTVGDTMEVDNTRTTTRSAHLKAEGDVGPVTLSGDLGVSRESSRSGGITQIVEVERSWASDGKVHQYAFPVRVKAVIGSDLAELGDPREHTEHVGGKVQIVVSPRQGTAVDADRSSEHAETGWVDEAAALPAMRPAALPTDYDVEAVAPVRDLLSTLTTMLVPPSAEGKRAKAGEAVKRIAFGTRPPQLSEQLPSSGGPDEGGEQSSSRDLLGWWSRWDLRQARMDLSAGPSDELRVERYNDENLLGSRDLVGSVKHRMVFGNARVRARDDSHRFTTTRNTHMALPITWATLMGPSATAGVSESVAEWLSLPQELTLKYRRGPVRGVTRTLDTVTSHSRVERGYLVEYDVRHEVTTAVYESLTGPLGGQHPKAGFEQSKVKFTPHAVLVWVPASHLPTIGVLSHHDIDTNLHQDDRAAYEKAHAITLPPTRAWSGGPPSPPVDARSALPSAAAQGVVLVDPGQADVVRSLMAGTRQKLRAWEATIKDTALRAKFAKVHDGLEQDFGEALVLGGFDVMMNDMFNGGLTLLGERVGDSGKTEQLIVVKARPIDSRHAGVASEHTHTTTVTTTNREMDGRRSVWTAGASAGATPTIPSFAASFLIDGLIAPKAEAGREWDRGKETERTRRHTTTYSWTGDVDRYDAAVAVSVELHPWSRSGDYRRHVLGLRQDHIRGWHDVGEFVVADEAIQLSLPVDLPLGGPPRQTMSGSLRERWSRAENGAPDGYPDSAALLAWSTPAPLLHAHVQKLAKDLNSRRAYQLLAETTASLLRSQFREMLTPDGKLVDVGSTTISKVTIAADLRDIDLMGPIPAASINHSVTDEAGQIVLRSTVTTTLGANLLGGPVADLLGNMGTTKEFSKGNEVDYGPVTSSAETGEGMAFLVRAQLSTTITTEHRNGTGSTHETGPDGTIWFRVDEAGLIALGLDTTASAEPKPVPEVDLTEDPDDQPEANIAGMPAPADPSLEWRSRYHREPQVRVVSAGGFLTPEGAREYLYQEFPALREVSEPRYQADAHTMSCPEAVVATYNTIRFGRPFPVTPNDLGRGFRDLEEAFGERFNLYRGGHLDDVARHMLSLPGEAHAVLRLRYPDQVAGHLVNVYRRGDGMVFFLDMHPAVRSFATLPRGLVLLGMMTVQAATEPVTFQDGEDAVAEANAAAEDTDDD